MLLQTCYYVTFCHHKLQWILYDSNALCFCRTWQWIMHCNLKILSNQFSGPLCSSCCLTTWMVFSLCIEKWEVVGLAMHLFFCSAMIGIWKKPSDKNICLLHLCLLTSLPYWSFQDISWLARRVQCQSAFDHFTLSSTRVLNSSQPRKHFEAYRFSSDFWPRCWNIFHSVKKKILIR